MINPKSKTKLKKITPIAMNSYKLILMKNHKYMNGAPQYTKMLSIKLP